LMGHCQLPLRLGATGDGASVPSLSLASKELFRLDEFLPNSLPREWVDKVAGEV